MNEIMKNAKVVYPDLSELYARKQRGRREAANRSLGEKIALVEAMRERLLPLKQARRPAARGESMHTKPGTKKG